MHIMSITISDKSVILGDKAAVLLPQSQKTCIQKENYSDL